MIRTIQNEEFDTMTINRSQQQIGLVLFFFYLLLYGGFVLLMAFDVERLQALGPARINLAVWSGFGLIVLALVLALVYGWICRATGAEENGDAAAAGEDTE
ncbi:MAG TPA: DUF485 domain-containing protein [Planctomycetaceae bacterium]|nr:DUF485 domain-containing protein [Planctomycetaceae bacterium]